MYDNIPAAMQGYLGQRYVTLEEFDDLVYEVSRLTNLPLEIIGRGWVEIGDYTLWRSRPGNLIFDRKYNSNCPGGVDELAKNLVYCITMLERDKRKPGLKRPR